MLGPAWGQERGRRAARRGSAGSASISRPRCSRIFINTDEHVRKEARRAIALLAPACDNGHGLSCFVLGSYYVDSKGTA